MWCHPPRTCHRLWLVNPPPLPLCSSMAARNDLAFVAKNLVHYCNAKIKPIMHDALPKNAQKLQPTTAELTSCLTEGSWHSPIQNTCTQEQHAAVAVHVSQGSVSIQAFCSEIKFHTQCAHKSSIRNIDSSDLIKDGVSWANSDPRVLLMSY